MRRFDHLLESALDDINIDDISRDTIYQLVNAAKESEDHHEQKKYWDKAEELAELLQKAGGDDFRSDTKRRRKNWEAEQKGTLEHDDGLNQPGARLDDTEPAKGGITTGIVRAFRDRGYSGA